MGKYLTSRWLLQTSALLLLGVTTFRCKAGVAQAMHPLPIPSAPNVNRDQASDQTQQQKSSVILRVFSENVLLDISVNDKKGRPVRGLTRDDFTILEDGVPQRIVSFESTTSEPRTAGSAIPIHSTAELDRLEPDAPVSIVVLDELTTNFEDEYFARYALKKYLGKQGEMLNQPMMLLARTIHRTMVLCDYTTSKKDIWNALSRHLVGNDWRAQNPAWKSDQFAAAFASLIAIAKATQGHPGHKNIIWIGRGFPAIPWVDLTQDQADALRSAIAYCSELLRDARVTLYVLDPSGVSSPSGTVDSNGVETIADPFADQVDLESMARATGGQALHGRNDVNNLIGQAVSNGNNFYTIAYRPASPETSDPMKFRTIKVLLRNKSLVATTREGYYPVQPGRFALNDKPGDKAQQAAFDLTSAITGLLPFDGIPLTITRDASGSDKFVVAFPAEAIGLKEEDGKLTGDVTLIVLSYDRSGKMLKSSGKVISLHLAPLRLGEIENRTIQIATSLDTQPPAARIRFVLRSGSTGKIGAENFFLVDRSILKDPETGIKADRLRRSQ